ncbi:Cyclophilin type peptidyl-prolyl cis-trans isomerase/CLD family protein [Arthrobacter sp. 9AX]|uniref:peptidylprolyl isomerase n=1 Tax=Arthrobacter sp. 9AX TaxID=2653131 RepID=UPI0012EF06D7|nr:peptidylprolyl isomerase [Arthrobacter sp. 9AX]VXB37599.1 Cyclophilin type peptidyl-prolyl cis-trans isomerase/CLD family protein [Arthrobacter sp. 9AX]
MPASSRSAREAKRRIQQMEAKRGLRRDQEQRRRRDNAIAAGAGTAAVVLAVVLQLTAFAGNPTEEEFAALEAGLSSPSASPSLQATNSPNVPAADTAAGKTFTGDLVLNGSPLAVELDGTKAPQAAAVFKSLSDEGYFNAKTCHRLTTGETFGLLQCGASGPNGQGDPSYTWGPLENTPADNTYPAGTIAVARSGNNAFGNGKQFFIVYKDTVIPADSAGGYTVVGRVTSGLDVVSNIAAAGITPGSSDTDGAPVEPVTIDSFSLK